MMIQVNSLIMDMKPQGPSPLDGNDVAIVSEVTVDNNEEAWSYVLSKIDPLSPSIEMEVDICIRLTLFVWWRTK